MQTYAHSAILFALLAFALATVPSQSIQFTAEPDDALRSRASSYDLGDVFDGFGHFELLEEYEAESPGSTKMVPKKLQCSCTFEKIAPVVSPVPGSAAPALLETSVEQKHAPALRRQGST